MENIENEIKLDSPALTITWSSDVPTCRNLLLPHNGDEDDGEGVTTFSLEKVGFLGIEDFFLVLRNDLHPDGLLKRVEFQYKGTDYENKLSEINRVLEEIIGEKPELVASSDESVWFKDGVRISSSVWASAWGEIIMLSLDKS